MLVTQLINEKVFIASLPNPGHWEYSDTAWSPVDEADVMEHIYEARCDSTTFNPNA